MFTKHTITALTFLIYSIGHAQNFEHIPAHSDMMTYGLGEYVSASGERVAIGDRFNGLVVVFNRESGRWVREGAFFVGDQILSMDLDGSRLAVGLPFISVGDAQQVGEVHIYDKLDNTWQLSSKIASPDASASTRFGNSVDVDGDRLIVGAPRSKTVDPPAAADGKVYLFDRTASGRWIQSAALSSNDNTAGHRFGYRVRFAGSNQFFATSNFANFTPAVAGSRGFLYVFSQNSGVWTQTQRLYAGNPNGGFSKDIKVAGDFAATISNTGLELLFRTGQTWAFGTPITTNATGVIDHFDLDSSAVLWSEGSGLVKFAARIGSSFVAPTVLAAETTGAVALTTTTAVVANSDASFGSARGFGYAAGFDRSNPSLPAFKYFRSTNGNFGPSHSVASQSGSTLLVSAPFDDTAGVFDQGKVDVYSTAGSIPTKLITLTTPSSAVSAQFGATAIVSGNLAAISAPKFNDSEGRVFVYLEAGADWTLLCTLGSEQTAVKAQFGESMAFDGRILAGKDFANGNVVRTFDVTSAGCVPLPTLLPTSGSSIYFGDSLAISGQTVLMSAFNPTDTSWVDIVAVERIGNAWGPQTLLEFAVPAGLQASLHPFRLIANGTRVAAVDRYCSNLFCSSTVLHNWTHTGASFMPTPADVFRFADIVTGISINGSGNAWGTVPAWGNPGSVKVSATGTSAPINLPAPVNTDLGNSILTPTALYAGFPYFNYPNNTRFGAVWIYPQAAGIFSTPQPLPILPDLIFVEGVEDVP